MTDSIILPEPVNKFYLVKLTMKTKKESCYRKEILKLPKLNKNTQNKLKESSGKSLLDKIGCKSVQNTNASS
jgi:hypothetical protein